MSQKIPFDKVLHTIDPPAGTRYTLRTCHLQGFEDVLELSEQVYQTVVQPRLLRSPLSEAEAISLGTASHVCAALRLEPQEENQKRVARALACCATSSFSIEVQSPDRSSERRAGCLFEILAWEREGWVPQEPFRIRFVPLLAVRVQKFEILSQQQRGEEQVQ